MSSIAYACGKMFNCGICPESYFNMEDAVACCEGPKPDYKSAMRAAYEERHMDNVNSPPHYQHGGMETIDIIHMMLGDQGLVNYAKGNAIKYISRSPFKGAPAEDLKKAAWYLERAAKVLEEGENGR